MKVMYVDTPYTRFKSLMPKTSLPWVFKTRNMYRICCKKYIYSLFSATNFRNLQQSDWLQDRFDSWLIKRATSLLNSVCSDAAKQVARLCRPSYPVPMPSRYQISIVQCPYPKKKTICATILAKTTTEECEMSTSVWRASLKRKKL